MASAPLMLSPRLRLRLLPSIMAAMEVMEATEATEGDTTATASALLMLSPRPRLLPNCTMEDTTARTTVDTTGTMANALLMLSPRLRLRLLPSMATEAMEA